MKRSILKIIGFIAGCGAGLFATHGILIILSNAGAKMHPDGLPLDPAWVIISQFAIAIILAIVARAVYPDQIRKNRYRKNYKSRLPSPLKRVL